MLLGLRVSNFGIIEQIDWHPGDGLNVITGETGAGKSLVIDAVETLLSGKASEDVIRHGAEEAFLEAVFEVSKEASDPRLYELLAGGGLLEPGEHSIVISGEIRRRGRSTFRVNGRAVPRGALNRIGSLLVDIHGQSDHLSLLNRDFHIAFLDAFARSAGLRSQFGEKANQLMQTEQELRAINEQEKERARQQEFLRFQINELRRADLKEGEEESLKRERDRLGSSEKLKEAAYEAYQAIYGDDSPASGASALERLNETARALQRLVSLDDTLKPQLEYIREVESGLREVAHDIHSYRDRIEYDPQRLEEVELRLELIRGLKGKYGQTIAEILDYREKAEKQLALISTSEARRQQLEKEITSLRREMGNLASRLSRQRAGAARKLAAKANHELNELDMPQVKFEVSITRAPSEEGIPFPDGKLYAFTREGVDAVEFQASTNPGEPLKPLAVIASAGEISRFMLALKSALAEADNIPVLIFDEIDIGIGGRSGEVVGKKLWSIARRRQAICITHLPQIAVFADRHYSVHKEAAGNRTTSLIETLDGDARTKEIAVMLSGPHHSDTAMRNARELIARAAAWKKTAPEKH